MHRRGRRRRQHGRGRLMVIVATGVGNATGDLVRDRGPASSTAHDSVPCSARRRPRTPAPISGRRSPRRDTGAETKESTQPRTKNKEKKNDAGKTSSGRRGACSRRRGPEPYLRRVYALHGSETIGSGSSLASYSARKRLAAGPQRCLFVFCFLMSARWLFLCLGDVVDGRCRFFSTPQPPFP